MERSATSLKKKRRRERGSAAAFPRGQRYLRAALATRRWWRWRRRRRRRRSRARRRNLDHRSIRAGLRRRRRKRRRRGRSSWRRRRRSGITTELVPRTEQEPPLQLLFEDELVVGSEVLPNAVLKQVERLKRNRQVGVKVVGGIEVDLAERFGVHRVVVIVAIQLRQELPPPIVRQASREAI